MNRYALSSNGHLIDRTDDIDKALPIANTLGAIVHVWDKLAEDGVYLWECRPWDGFVRPVLSKAS